MPINAKAILAKVKSRMTPAVTHDEDDALIVGLIEEAEANFARQWGITLDAANPLHIRAIIIYVMLWYDGPNDKLDAALSNLYETLRG
jgi:hypothetical protein